MKARRVKRLDPAAPLADNAARIVRTRVRELRSFVPKALKPGAETTRHNMRIAAKRLRYVLEVTGFCLGPAAELAQKRARSLQQLLGEMHDCDVMLPMVEDQIERLQSEDLAALRDAAGDAPDLDPELSARAPNRAAYRGLQTLAVHLQARRDLLFDRFVEFWSANDAEGTWEELESLADAHLRRAKERRLAAEQAEADLTLGADRPPAAAPSDPGAVREADEGAPPLRLAP